MNTPNNRRRRESIEKIERVFLELLQTKELEAVSVSEICKAASLNRTTFYANFQDVYALADSIRDKLKAELAEVYREEIDTHTHSYDFFKLFAHISQNQIFYRTYFKLGYDDSYEIIPFEDEVTKARFDNRFVAYHMEFFKAGITRIIKLWLQNGCRETPEEMADVIRSEYNGRFFPEIPAPCSKDLPEAHLLSKCNPFQGRS